MQPDRSSVGFEGEGETKEGTTCALGDDQFHRLSDPGITIRKPERVAIRQLNDLLGIHKEARKLLSSLPECKGTGIVALTPTMTQPAEQPVIRGVRRFF